MFSQQFAVFEWVDQMPYVNWSLHVVSLSFCKLKHNVVTTEFEIPRSLDSSYVTNKKDLPIWCCLVHITLQQRYVTLY